MTNLAVPARIETFQRLMLAAAANTTVTLDAPDHADGTWMIDVRIDGLFLPTEWSQQRGFGLYTTLDLGFGERPTNCTVRLRWRQRGSSRSRAISRLGNLPN